jgi:hypothetical protein
MEKENENAVANFNLPGEIKSIIIKDFERHLEEGKYEEDEHGFIIDVNNDKILNCFILDFMFDENNNKNIIYWFFRYDDFYVIAMKPFDSRPDTININIVANENIINAYMGLSRTIVKCTIHDVVSFKGIRTDELNKNYLIHYTQMLNKEEVNIIAELAVYPTHIYNKFCELKPNKMYKCFY